MRIASAALRPLRWTLLTLLLVAPVAAQDFDDEAYSPPSEVYGVFDGGFALAIPSGDFRDQTGNVGYGVNLGIGVGSRTLPFVVGIEGGFFVLGSHTDNVALSTTIRSVFVDVETTNSLAQGHLFLRMQPGTGVLRPYVEGLVGAKYLSTQTTVQNEGFRDDEAVFRSTNFDDWAFSYGVGAGAAIEVYRNRDPQSDLGTVSILVSARWTPGSTAEYLADAEISDRDNDGRVTNSDLTISRSRTDVIVPSIGVSITF